MRIYVLIVQGVLYYLVVLYLNVFFPASLEDRPRLYSLYQRYWGLGDVNFGEAFDVFRIGARCYTKMEGS